VATATNPCNDSFLSQIWSGNAIVCSDTFKNYETKNANTQIQSVVDNAKTNYGEGSATAQIAESVATQQEAQTASDVENVNQAVAKSKVGQIFTTCDSGDSGLAIPGLPCISFKWIALGIGGLVVLYFLALVSSVIPRPR
jgi:ribulose 1,5-bisphosphate carboxylase large subunit-like protein